MKAGLGKPRTWTHRTCEQSDVLLAHAFQGLGWGMVAGHPISGGFQVDEILVSARQHTECLSGARADSQVIFTGADKGVEGGKVQQELKPKLEPQVSNPTSHNAQA